MNIGKSRKTSDLAALDGATFGLDKAMTLVSFVLLFVIVFIPIFMIVYNAFFFEGKFDIEMFQTVVFSKDNVEAMTNTVIIGVAVTIFGTIVGLFYAWLLGRSDIPCKGLMRALFMIPYMFPPFFGAMAWDMLLSGRGGYVNTWLMNTFGFETAPLNINSLWGIIFVEVSYYFPFVFMQVVSALERMDPTLEESARIAGASQGTVIRKITIPLVTPAISAGALLILISSLAHFGVPAILGFSKQIYTLPRHHQGQEHASYPDQTARRKISAAVLIGHHPDRHCTGSPGHDFPGRPGQSLWPAAYPGKLYAGELPESGNQQGDHGFHPQFPVPVHLRRCYLYVPWRYGGVCCY